MPGPISKPTSSPSSDNGSAFVDAFVRSRDAQSQAILHKYNSYSSLQKDQKAKYVKNLKLNPTNLNSYDRLSNAYWRWAKLAASQHAAAATPDKKAAAASNYYDKVLAPTYKQMGAEAMPKDLWIKQAYEAALKYDPENGMYSGSAWKGMQLGAIRGFADLERIGGVAIDALGSVMKHQGDWTTWPTGKERGESVLDRIHKDVQDVPVMGYISRSIRNAAETDQFFADAVPAKGFMENASSIVAEQALLMPLYAGIGASMGAAVDAAKGVPIISNLTQNLGETVMGRRILPVLLAGVEGAVTGAALTAPGEDPVREAWQSAIGFAVTNAAVRLAGAGIKATGLGGYLEGKAKGLYDKRLEALELGTKGKHLATSEEQTDAYKSAFAGYASVSGVPGLKAMGRQAVQFAQEHKGLSTLDLLKKKQDLLEADRAKWNPVFNTLGAMQKLAGKKPIGEMDEDEIGKLLASHDNLVSESLTKLPNTPPVQGITMGTAAQVAETPSGQAQLARKAKSLKAADAKGGMNANKPDSFYQERAKAWYVQQNVKGAATMAQKSSELPIKEVEDIAKKRKDVANPVPISGEAAGHTKYRSQYQYDAKGSVTGYSMSASKDYKVYATRAAKESGFGDLKEWFSDLSNEDFSKDLQDWFYPEDLKQAGFYFEHEGHSPADSMHQSYADTNNPNFLAFMYNYKDHMPPEMADELKTRLTDQAKVSMKLGANVDEERLVRYYALQMWNHVDDFLGALPQHAGERNLFRSTQSDLLNPTKYQKQLLEEKMAEERKNFQSMYRKQPEVLQSVLQIYDKLAGERYKAMAATTKSVGAKDVQRAQYRQDLNKEIGSMQTEGGQNDPKFDYPPWRF